MKMYELNRVLEDEKGVPPFLITNDLKVPTDYYKKHITLTKFDNSNESIYLELTKYRGGNLVLRDYHRWDLGQPNAYFIVCSAKFSFVLTELKLPKYKLYKAEIDVKGKKHKYYVLHFIQEYLHDIDYSQSQFAETHLLRSRGGIIRICKVGEIKNTKQYHSINKRLVDEMIYMYPKKIYFKPEKKYDIWGLRGQIIISEKAKKAIEKAGITGVYMPNIKDVKMFKDLEVV